jgi:predicted NUDIX family phosphoesterase
MANIAEERVLVVSEEHFRKVGYFEGFRFARDGYEKALLDPAAFRFMHRSQAELDPRFKQIIPYCVLTHLPGIFRYQRTSGGTEKRLASLCSIGLGGHINPEDGQEGDADLYFKGMQRELKEEVEIGEIVQEYLHGFIYDPLLAVGQVHLGVVHLLELKEPSVRLREEKLQDGRFEDLVALRRNRDKFETWSQLILDAWI